MACVRRTGVGSLGPGPGGAFKLLGSGGEVGQEAWNGSIVRRRPVLCRLSSCRDIAQRAAAGLCFGLDLKVMHPCPASCGPLKPFCRQWTLGFGAGQAARGGMLDVGTHMPRTPAPARCRCERDKGRPSGAPPFLLPSLRSPNRRPLHCSRFVRAVQALFVHRESRAVQMPCAPTGADFACRYRCAHP